MRLYKFGLLIILALLIITGCHAPRTVIDVTKNEEVEIEKEEVSDKKDALKTSEIDFTKKHVRPDGKYITLRIGEYLVGRDFEPGRYYLYKEKIDGSDLAEILYYSEEQGSFHYPGCDIKPSFDAPSAFFEEGQKIKVDWDTIVLSSEYVPLEDFYEVEKPEGTYVSIGRYRVGIDIPVGSYKIYPTSFKSSQCVLFSDEEALKNHKASLNDVYYGSYLKDSYGMVVNLSEGNVFDVRGPVYMKKIDALNFD